MRTSGFGPLVMSAANSILNAQDRVNLAGEQLVAVSSPPTSRGSPDGLTRKAGVAMPDGFDTPYSSRLAQAATNLSYATIGYTAAASLVKVSDAMSGEVLDLLA